MPLLRGKCGRSGRRSGKTGIRRPLCCLGLTKKDNMGQSGPDYELGAGQDLV